MELKTLIHAEPIKYYISPLNSLIGHGLVKELKDKTDSQNCVIVGKSDDVDENDVPDLVDTVFEKEKTMKELIVFINRQLITQRNRLPRETGIKGDGVARAGTGNRLTQRVLSRTIHKVIRIRIAIHNKTTAYT